MKSPTTAPTKEQIRHWLDKQIKERKPISTPAQIRTELGWHLVNKLH